MIDMIREIVMKTIYTKGIFSILSAVLVLNMASLACSLPGSNSPTMITVVATQSSSQKSSPQSDAPQPVATQPAAPSPTAPKPLPPTKKPAPSTQVSPIDGMKLLYVPAGEFQMGSDKGQDKEKPVHTVSLDAFWIDQTDVTNAMFAQYVSSGGGNEPPSQNSSNTRKSYYQNSEYADYPVIWVDWSQADAYCKWAGRSLPTEAQWEKAARGTDGRTYPWGEGADPGKANFNGKDTTKVGSYPEGASPYGALDMAGNVFQWVADWYSDTYYQNSPDKNPPGAGPDESPSGSARVLRGGAWDGSGEDLRSFTRANGNPSSGKNSDIGIRCALNAEQ